MTHKYRWNNSKKVLLLQQFVLTMVLESDFKVELVEAHTKNPFKEHYKDGEHYVEIEPDTEYYVSFQRIFTQLKQDLVVGFFVDGQNLIWQLRYVDVPETDDEPTYVGLLSKETHVARTLLFAKPSALNMIAGGASDRSTKVGEVEVKIYERDMSKPIVHYDSSDDDDDDDDDDDVGNPIAETNEQEVFGRLKVAPNLASTKRVQTTLGDSPVQVKVSKMSASAGNLLHTIVLKYRTVPGLIQDGVLPRPPNIYMQHNIFNGKQNKPIPPLKVQPKRFSDERGYNHWEEFDLTTLDSDSDDGGSDDDDTDNDHGGKKQGGEQEEEATKELQPAAGAQQRKRSAESQETPSLIHETQKKKKPKSE